MEQEETGRSETSQLGKDDGRKEVKVEMERCFFLLHMISEAVISSSDAVVLHITEKHLHCAFGSQMKTNETYEHEDDTTDGVSGGLKQQQKHQRSRQCPVVWTRYSV